jgi:hypothetical protein
VIFAATGAAALWIQKKRLPGLVGAERFLAFATLWIAAVLLAHLLPAIATVLSRWSVLVAALAIAAAARFVPPGRRSEPSPPPPPVAASRLPEWVLAGLAVVAAAAYVLGFLRVEGPHALSTFDALSFHLPGVARWIQSGSVWQNDELVPGYAFGNYPHYGDFLQLASVLPWRNDFLARLVNVPLLGLAGVAVYAIASELRAPRALSVSMGAALVAVPTATVSALLEGQVDTLMLAAFGIGVVFLLRHARTGALSDLVMAGLGIGIAFGTKWYALPYTIALLAGWAVVLWRSGAGPRLVARRGALLGGVVLAAGGFWLLRNLIEVGNPLFPQKVSALGTVIFDAPRDTVRERYGQTISEYLGNGPVLKEFVWPTLRAYLRVPGGLVVAGSLGAAVLLVRDRLRGRSWPRSGAAVSILLLAIVLAVLYTVTPNSALGPEGRPIFISAAARYLAPAVLFAAAVTAWAGGRSRWLGLAIQLGAVVGIVQSMELTLDVPHRRVVQGALAVALAAAAVALWPRLSARLGPGRRRPALVVGIIAAALLVVVGGYRFEESFNDQRYRDVDTPLTYINSHAPSGAKIGIAGSWGADPPPILPSFGPRYRNRVEFVGPMEREMLRTYRRRGPFISALTRGRYDLLLVGRFAATAGFPRKLPGERPEEVWARSVGYKRVARSWRLTLYRAPGPQAAIP